MFTRLELREILNHLNTNTCDEEVVAKLRTLANMPSQQTARLREPGDVMGEALAHNQERREQDRFQAERFNSQATRIEVVDAIETHPIITSMRREDYGHLDDNAYAALIESRKNSLRQDMKKAGAIPMNAMAPPEIHDRRLEQVPVGSKNSAGDRCVNVMNGFSVYACANQHGYLDNNPAVPIGCPTCSLNGNVASTREEVAQTQMKTALRDDGAIPGEESF